MPVATVTSKGQVTIPKAIRDFLGLRSGDRVDFWRTPEGKVVLEPLMVDLRSLKGILKADRKVTIEEMNEAIRRGGTRQ
ncbi:MAG: AbrB/MazE/SpoVT family DNA-binding domain-containing protein [Planctomycetota bacterium]|jgi:AbrB family looped-hinge helix DNA binding protein